MPTTAANRAPREVPELDDVRARILTAAEEVFAARGYAGATTREIAERAGIGKRMLFYYFPSKDAVYRAVLERILVGLVAIHEHTRNAPGPVGLADAIEAITGERPALPPRLKPLLTDPERMTVLPNDLAAVERFVAARAEARKGAAA